MISNPKISIIIPVKNGILTLQKCLVGIQKQTLFNQCEIIIIDSGSSDGTLELIQDFSVRLYQIPPEEFNHGATRNYGVSLAKGEFVVMTVQDAIPVNEYWLENMLKHFKDLSIAGVCGQQIVPHHNDKNPHSWFRPVSKSSNRSISFKNRDEFLMLRPEKQKSICSWDDVTAMYRKEVLLEIPFKPVMFGEDMIWAKEALLSGYRLMYDQTSQVEHYHHHTPQYTYHRIMVVWIFTYLTFNYFRPNPYSISDYTKVIYRNLKWRISFKWIIHNWGIIWYSTKAIKKVDRHIKNKSINMLIEELNLNIPIGRIQ